MPYRIVHRTSYTYDSPVSASYGELYLLPRASDAQRVVQTDVVIDPRPNTYTERNDFFGNRAANFAVLERHTALTVTTTSIVEVTGRRVPQRFEGPSWEHTRDLCTRSLEPDVLDARQFVLDSPNIEVTPAVRDYAAPSFLPDRPVVDVLGDLTSRIFQDFEYKPGATDLATTPDELLALRKGVCQDFAQLQIACLRAFGIPARYVSGYLETLPPPGKPKLQGADVSHAWVGCFVPGIGWVDVDPTNNLFVEGRHICTAWGREYADISPLKGVIFTEAKTNTMRVSVDVTSVT